MKQRAVTIARRTNTVDGYETLAALVADTDPEVVWEKPVAKLSSQRWRDYGRFGTDEPRQRRSR